MFPVNLKITNAANALNGQVNGESVMLPNTNTLDYTYRLVYSFTNGAHMKLTLCAAFCDIRSDDPSIGFQVDSSQTAANVVGRSLYIALSVLCVNHLASLLSRVFCLCCIVLLFRRCVYTGVLLGTVCVYRCCFLVETYVMMKRRVLLPCMLFQT